MKPKSVDDYMKLPYHIELIRDEEGGGWVSMVRELRGCLSQGETPEEAVEMIQDAMHGWLTSRLKHGDPIPMPQADAVHSGKFLVRMPAGLHTELAERAEAEGVSLNHLVVALLAGGVGWPNESRKHKQDRQAS